MAIRKAKLLRQTKETTVEIDLNLDTPGKISIATAVPFMDHMLHLMAYHAGFSLVIKASGDTHIDDHHLVEDIGITLGKVLSEALGDKKRINRYGHFLLPMDESLAYVAMDLSGRPFLDYEVPFAFVKTGFDFDLLQEFFHALAVNAGITLHIALKRGRNNHHIAESVFKGFGRALAQAVRFNGKAKGIPSTKGRLE